MFVLKCILFTLIRLLTRAIPIALTYWKATMIITAIYPNQRDFSIVYFLNRESIAIFGAPDALPIMPFPCRRSCLQICRTGWGDLQRIDELVKSMADGLVQNSGSTTPSRIEKVSLFWYSEGSVRVGYREDEKWTLISIERSIAAIQPV